MWQFLSKTSGMPGPGMADMSRETPARQEELTIILTGQSMKWYPRFWINRAKSESRHAVLTSPMTLEEDNAANQVAFQTSDEGQPRS